VGAVVRPRRRSSPDASGLPADLAAGPDPRIWVGDRSTPYAEWGAAGETWSKAHGLGHSGWKKLLAEDVRYAVSALGRAHIRHGGLVPPWEQR
jgi:hypothetical protein